MIDIYLNEKYSPFFYEEGNKIGIAILSEKEEALKMVLRNRIQAEVNKKFLDSIDDVQKITEDFKRMIVNIILNQAQYLGVNISSEDLENIKYEVENKKISINLTF